MLPDIGKYRRNDSRLYSRTGFGLDQIQEIRASRDKKQNQYFISHNNDENYSHHSNIKEKEHLQKFSWGHRFTK